MSVAGPAVGAWNPPLEGQDQEACIAACQSRYPITCYLPGVLTCSCVEGCRRGEPPATGLFGSGYEVEDIAGGIYRYGVERPLELISEALVPLAVIVVGGIVLYLFVLTR